MVCNISTISDCSTIYALQMTTLPLRLSMRGFIVLWCVLFVGGATLDEDMYSFAAASPNFVLSVRYGILNLCSNFIRMGRRF